MRYLKRIYTIAIPAFLLILIQNGQTIAEPCVGMRGSVYLPAGRMAELLRPGPGIMVEGSIALGLYDILLHIETGYIDMDGNDERMIGASLIPVGVHMTVGIPFGSFVMEPGVMAGTHVMITRFYASELDMLLKHVTTNTSSDPVFGCSLYASRIVSSPVSIIAGVEYRAMFESSSVWNGFMFCIGARCGFGDTAGIR